MSTGKIRLFSVSCMVAFLLMAASGALWAQTPIAPNTWTGSPASAAGPSGFTTLPATTTPGAATVAVSQWDRGAVVFNAAGACYNSRDWEVGGTLASAIANNRFISFTVTNSATTQLQITRLFIRSQVSATGPQKVRVQYTLGATTANFGGEVATATSAAPEDWTITDVICVPPSQTITFRLYGWAATGAAGTLRINDGTAIFAFFTTPIVATATNTSPVCAGNLLDFNTTVSGGLPGYTYSWSGPDGFTSTLPNPSIPSALPTASGVYTVTVTDALSCNTSFTPVTTTVTVNTAPAAITGTLIVCPGLTTTLSSATAGGTWSSANPAIATVATGTGVVTGVTAGTVEITYQLGSLCQTTAIVTVDVPPADIVGGLSLCQGLTSSLSSPTPGGTWFSTDATVATVSGTGVVFGVAPGTATISYTIPSGCFTTSVVTVYPFPSAVTGPTAVCVNDNITLSNASAGGTWTSSNTTVATVDAAGVVTGVSAGTANISYILGGGCSSSLTITVNPLPAAIGGPSTVCVGAVSTFTNATPGGTWSSSDIAVATIGAGTGVMLPLSAGTTIITYTNTATTCFITRTVTVNPSPVAITGASGVCLGATVTLANATPGGTWISSNATVATIGSASGVVNGLVTGTTNITYTVTATGCIATRVQTVHPLPTAISGPATVCPGLSITWSSSPAGGNWTSANTTIAIAAPTTGVITGVAPGLVNITYTLPTGCLAVRSVSVNPAPPASITPLGDTTFCPGDFVALSANTGAGLTYQWYTGATPISGAVTATYIATATGSIRVRVFNVLGCPTFSTPMAILVDAVTATITPAGGITTACASTPVVLNATAGTGYTYQWSLDGVPITGATGASLTTTASGNYTVRITNTTGCSDVSAPVAVTLISSPSDVVTISGPLTFCFGSTVTLTVGTGAGYSYQWFDVGGAIAGATSNLFTATGTGAYYATITNTDGCVATTAITNVVVNPLPDPTITLGGPSVFCVGGGVLLSAFPGLTYQWYKNGVAISGANAASYAVTSTGGYRVRVSNPATGCTSMTAADSVITLIDNPIAIALTPARFCWGGSALLSTTFATLGSGANYQWSFNGTPIPGATNGTYSAPNTGDYSCAITVSGVGGCTVASNDVSVNEVPLPDPIVSQSGTLLRVQTFYTSYQWYKNLVSIPGATTHTIAHTGSGNYKVRVTDTNGCQSMSSSYVLNGGTTVVGNTSTHNINIFPNPAHSTVYIQSDVTVTAVITSMDGRVVIRKANATTVDIAALADGVYLLTLYDDTNTAVRLEKLVKHSN